MGIGMFLPIIGAIVMTTILGASVGPSIVENMKVKKVENRTISNQIAIKDAVVRYIAMTGENPKDLEDLKSKEILKDYHEDNFFGGTYSFFINEENGTLTIYTQINDDNASKYFKNSFKTQNVPTCVEKVGEACKDNLFETFYLLDNFKGKKVVEVGSAEYIAKVFTKEKLGNKEYYNENPPKDGDKDHVYIAEDKVEEFIYDEINKEWVSNGEKVIGGIGKNSGVEIKNVEVPNARIEGDYRIVENKLYEKVVCNENSLQKEIFVVNENTKLGEIVYVAETKDDAKTKIDNGFIANNICTTNITDMSSMFMFSKINQPLNRWDVSNVYIMGWMFYDAKKFNQDLNSWNTSNVENMYQVFYKATSFNGNISTWDVSNIQTMEGMFHSARSFNQPLNAWDVSNVKNMHMMFMWADSFNKDLNAWNVSNVTNMNAMFNGAYAFNGDISTWDVSNVEVMESMFNYATSFNGDISTWDISNVRAIGSMFRNATSFNQNISNWNLINLNDIAFMFRGATSFNQDLSKWIICDKDYYNYDYDTPSWKSQNKPKTSCP